MAEEEIRPFDRPGADSARRPGLPTAGLAIFVALALAGIGLLAYALAGFPASQPAPEPTAPAPAALDLRTSIPTVIAPPPSPTLPGAATGTGGVTPPLPTPTPAADGVTPPLPTPTGTSGVTPPVPTPTGTGGVTSPTATSAPAAAGGSRGLSGELTLCVPKASYATNIERICFVEKIINATDQPIRYGVLGVRAANQSGGPSKFQTSWSGDFFVAANCTGPRDTCGGAWEDGMFLETPGTYVLTLDICYSDQNTCLSGGEWESLTPGITIQLVDWTPSP